MQEIHELQKEGQPLQTRHHDCLNDQPQEPISPHMAGVYEAFLMLSDSRYHMDGYPQPIQLSEIIAVYPLYAHMEGKQFIECIQELDREHLNFAIGNINKELQETERKNKARVKG